MYLVKSLVIARRPVRAGMDVDWAVGQIREVDDDQINHYKNNASAFTILSQTGDERDNALALAGGYLETVLPIGSAVSVTTATPVDVCTRALTEGEWDVDGVVDRVLTGTTATQYAAAISPTADTVPAHAGGGGVSADSATIENAVFGAAVSGNYITRVGPVRVLVPAGGLTIHLVVADTFSAGTVGAFGSIRARRVSLLGA